MTNQVPRSELADRLRRIQARMDAEQPQWVLAAILGRVNQYYFTGTMQDGVLLIPRGGEAVLWVRRSFEHACAEFLLPAIRPMNSFRDAAQSLGRIPETIHIEADLVPFGLVQRFRKHFPCREVAALGAQVAKVRAVKSAYELALTERAGEIHRLIMEEDVPKLLREGISETEFGADLFPVIVRQGDQGVVRFGAFGVETLVGQIGFGESSLCPTSMDSPGGCQGLALAAPVLGSAVRKLRRGDLVFLDTGCSAEMVIALEPKRGVAGVGMVGSENTYLVTPNGGKSLTGNHPGLMVVRGI